MERRNFITIYGEHEEKKVAPKKYDVTILEGRLQ